MSDSLNKPKRLQFHHNAHLRGKCPWVGSEKTLEPGERASETFLTEQTPLEPPSSKRLLLKQSVGKREFVEGREVEKLP